MQDDDLLRQKLKRLGQTDEVYIDGARVISEATGFSAMRAILDEIDDTVLMAALTFAKGTSSATVSVSGRRLVLLSAVSQDLEPGPPLNERLQADEEAPIAQIGEALAALVASGGPLTVRVAAADGLDDATEGGIAVARLTEIWLNEQPLPDGTPLEQLFILASEAITAKLLVDDGDIVQTDGGPSLLPQLQDAYQTRLEPLRDALNAQSNAYEDAFLTCFDGVLGADIGLGLAIHGAQAGLFAYPAAARGSIFSIWRRIT